MLAQHTFDGEGRWDGRTLSEIVPLAAAEIAAALDPVEIILFGSVARGEDNANSDIDLLVVFDAVVPSEKRALMVRTRTAIVTVAPIDILVTDLAEIDECRDRVGSILYWPMREGRSVYRRDRAHAT